MSRQVRCNRFAHQTWQAVPLWTSGAKVQEDAGFVGQPKRLSCPKWDLHASVTPACESRRGVLVTAAHGHAAVFGCRCKHKSDLSEVKH